MIPMNKTYYEVEEEWRKVMMSIPFIKFPADWEVQPMPPFSGALARFRVRLPNGDEKSVYLDYWNHLGFEDGPYWEVYPVNDEPARCMMNEIPELLKLIAEPR